MTSGPLPQAEIDWLCEAAKPYASEPKIMLLGGTRGGKVGSAPLKSSDFDILVVADHIVQPLSLTLHSPVSGNKVDLILRDADTLAYECNSARTGGNASLINIASFSQIVLDVDDRAGKLQQGATALYAKGPWPVTAASLTSEVGRCFNDLAVLSYQRDDNKRLATVLSLKQRFGWLALRANRHWVARGKVLARNLQAHLPAFKTQLDEAGRAALEGRVIPLHEIGCEVERLHQPGENAISLQRQSDFPRQPTIPEVYHYGRFTPVALVDYLYSPQPEVKAAAQDWTHYMHTLTGSAVDSERFARPNGEYEYALGRHLNELMDVACFIQRTNPSKLPLQDRIAMLHYAAPDVLTALPAAMAGQPDALHKAGDALLERLIGPLQPLQPRPALASLRYPAHKLGLI